jgi:hypothetical protein
MSDGRLMVRSLPLESPVHSAETTRLNNKKQEWGHLTSKIANRVGFILHRQGNRKPVSESTDGKLRKGETRVL